MGELFSSDKALSWHRHPRSPVARTRAPSPQPWPSRSSPCPRRHAPTLGMSPHRSPQRKALPRPSPPRKPHRRPLPAPRPRTRPSPPPPQRAMRIGWPRPRRRATNPRRWALPMRPDGARGYVTRSAGGGGEPTARTRTRSGWGSGAPATTSTTADTWPPAGCATVQTGSSWLPPERSSAAG